MTEHHIERPVQREVPLRQTGWRKLIKVFAPGLHVPPIEIESETIEELDPELVEEGPFTWERYCGSGEHDYVEVRQDLIWSRELMPLMEPDLSLDVGAGDPETAGPFRPPEAGDRRHEER